MMQVQQVRVEDSDYQRYLLAKGERPRRTVVFVRTGEGLSTFDADAQRVAAMLERRTIRIERQQTIRINAADLRGLVRVGLEAENIEGV